MKYKDIVYNIKAKNFEKIYLLYGKEHYLIDNSIKLFKESLNESMIDFNLDILDGKEIMLDQLLSSIETLPFMDERKIVIVKDFELLIKGKKKNFLLWITYMTFFAGTTSSHIRIKSSNLYSFALIEIEREK